MRTLHEIAKKAGKKFFNFRTQKKQKEDHMQHKATCSQKFDTEDEFIRLLKKYQESPSKIKY